MEAVEERRVDHDVRERREQVAGLHQRFHCLALRQVPDEDHRCTRVDGLTAPAERPRGHVVLHDLDAVLILEVDACHLVEGHHVPQAHQAHLAGAHVVEQVGHRGLAAGHQDGVRADLLVDVALACAARPQLAQVVVVLHQRDHPRQQVPLHTFLEAGWLHARRAQQRVNPLFFGEPLAASEQLLHVHVWHLDRLEIRHHEGRGALVLFEPVVQRHDAPDAAHEKLLELPHVGVGHLGVLDAQVGQQRLVGVAVLVQLHGDLVDHFERTALSDLALHLLGLVRPHVVLSQHTLDGDQASADGLGVVRCAVHAQQVLQHVDGNVGPFLDELGKVLAHYAPGEALVEQLVQARVNGGGLRLCGVFSHVGP